MFHPVIETWLGRRFAARTAAQTGAWPLIAAGEDVLVTAPTGSGKTLAAFLACLDRLVRDAIDGALEDRTRVLYVSPLKALSNDIRVNLEEPLGQIAALAEEMGYPRPEIRTAVRTGDTTARELLASLHKHVERIKTHRTAWSGGVKHQSIRPEFENGLLLNLEPPLPSFTPRHHPADDFPVRRVQTRLV